MKRRAARPIREDGEDDMKVQSAFHGTDRARGAHESHVFRENALLASGVALAFAFVTACLFMLG